jgi:Zn finger protein HypA/HybF involved in hydrogenase expression
MHELSIATGIIELIESKVANPATVTKVALTASPSVRNIWKKH